MSSRLIDNLMPNESLQATLVFVLLFFLVLRPSAPELFRWAV